MTSEASNVRAIVFHPGGALGDFVLAWPIVRAVHANIGPVLVVTADSRARLVTKCLGVHSSSLHNDRWAKLWSGEIDWSLSTMSTVALVIGFAVNPAWIRAVRQAFSAAVFEFPEGKLDRKGSIAIAAKYGKADRIERVTRTSAPRILGHVGAGGRDKIWPLERWVELHSILAANGVVLGLVAGEVEDAIWTPEHRGLFERLGGRITGSLEELVDAIGGAGVFIGADSGPGHLAAQLGIVTLSLFGPTDPEAWAPVGPCVAVLAEVAVSDGLAFTPNGGQSSDRDGIGCRSNLEHNAGGFAIQGLLNAANMDQSMRGLGRGDALDGGCCCVCSLGGRESSERSLSVVAVSFWLPSIVVVPLGMLAVGVGMGVVWWLRPRGSNRSGVFRPSAILTAMLVGYGMVTLTVTDLRLFSRAKAPPTPDHRLRLIHWNACNDIGARWTQDILDLHPDFVAVDPASYQPWPELREGMGSGAIELDLTGVKVFSKLAILAIGTTALGIEPGQGIDPRVRSGMSFRVDPGHAAWIELDTRERFGRPTIVWLLDLPSDISLPRNLVVGEASKALAAFAGPVSVRSASGAMVPSQTQIKGFPPPDVIMGDMNIPRGSASLQRLTGGLTNAYDQAGHGFVGTWPYRAPLWHLDQTFVGPAFVATAYAGLDLGGGTHRGQLVDVALPIER